MRLREDCEEYQKIEVRSQKSEEKIAVFLPLFCILAPVLCLLTKPNINLKTYKLPLNDYEVIIITIRINHFMEGI